MFKTIMDLIDQYYLYHAKNPSKIVLSTPVYELLMKDIDSMWGGHTWQETKADVMMGIPVEVTESRIPELRIL